MAFLRSLFAASFALALPMTSSGETSTAETFGQMPETWSAKISPNGNNLALGCSPQGVKAVCIFELDSDARPKLISPPTGAQIDRLYWASDDFLLYQVSLFETVEFSSALTDVRVYRLLSYDMKTGKTAFLMRNARSVFDTTRVDSILLNKPNKIQMAFTFRMGDATRYNSRLSDEGSLQYIIYDVNLKTGKARVKDRYEKSVGDAIHDARGKRYAEILRNPKKKTFSVKSLITGKTIFKRDKTELPPFYVDGLGAGKESLIVFFDDNERYGLHTLSLIDGMITPYEAAGVEIGDASTIDDIFTGEVVGYRYTDHLPRRVYTNDVFAKVASDAKNALGSDSIILTSWTQDHRIFTVQSIKLGRPDQYYLYDIAEPSISPIGGEAPWLDEAVLGTIKPINYAARDGLNIPAYLTFPAGKSEADAPFPMLVLPHGGPEARDSATFDWLAQAFAAEGYLVMQPNFRGSSGYGADFRNAGYGQFGGKMVNDVVDSARWAVSEGLAHPLYCTLGWSYGGYSALMTALKEKTKVRCVVSINGVTAPRELLTDGDKYSLARDYWEQYMGDMYASDRSHWNFISPRARADEYSMPVLLIQGEEDTTVPPEQATSFNRALPDNIGKKLIMIPSDDHGLVQSGSRQRVLAESIAFLAEHHPAWD